MVQINMFQRTAIIGVRSNTSSAAPVSVASLSVISHPHKSADPYTLTTQTRGPSTWLSATEKYVLLNIPRQKRGWRKRYSGFTQKRRQSSERVQGAAPSQREGFGVFVRSY